jgi:hypothetical protein
MYKFATNTGGHETRETRETRETLDFFIKIFK